MDKLIALRSRLLGMVEKAKPVALLVLRLAVGLVFIQTGWGKVHDTDSVAGFFESLHVPAPHLNAVVVAWTELLGGAAMILGVAVRLFSIPLFITMVVATLTAVWPKLEDKSDFFTSQESHYLAIFFALIILGPGALSIDALIARMLDKKTKTA